jgi:SAM-dependent methyltransferase
MRLKYAAKRVAKKLLAKSGLAITRIGATSHTSSRGYLSTKETVSAAESEGLSVCDYVERLWEKPGETQKVIEQMVSCGAFVDANLNVVEIGTGTGRYLEKVLQHCKPAKYESYEVAGDWAKWLRETYPIVSHKADGVSLKQTSEHSVDLLHAHGVFVYLPFLVSYRYWIEMWRVIRNGGIVIFDIISEDCLDEKTVGNWLNTEIDYPCFHSRKFLVSLFGKHGFSLVKTFMNRYGEVKSEYLVFIRDKSAEQDPAPDHHSAP